ncbi:hypothetical protein [Nocardia sp. NPDC006630]|uniref:hypothetical protein n=1 Tax=Nocardia sp. NPDC006630 TaxID=3157181 RepID=UPI0033A39CBE
MSRDTLTLADIELEGMLENVPPALRSAVLRAYDSNNESVDHGAFCSFIDADLA